SRSLGLPNSSRTCSEKRSLSVSTSLRDWSRFGRQALVSRGKWPATWSTPSESAGRVRGRPKRLRTLSAVHGVVAGTVNLDDL
ncbi:unnamed protein product, partial [Ectocarpus fasciculatus]